MFPYRPTLLNSRTRILLAAFLALALHAVFMNSEFTARPVLSPAVSLPRSVTIYMQQPKRNVIVPAEPEPQMTTVRNIPARENRVEDIHPPVPRAETVKKPSRIVEEKHEIEVEKMVPVSQEPVKNAAASEPETAFDRNRDGTTDSHQQETADNSSASRIPGIEQTAYPRYQVNKPPTYPGLARKRGNEGTVIMQVLVNRDGRVDDLKLEKSSGFSLLDRAALSAVRNWSFEPGRRGEKRISMWVRVPVTFTLKN